MINKNLVEAVKNLTKEELAELLYLSRKYTQSYNNFVDLSYLDFSKFGCDVSISHMKVRGFLFQDHQKVKYSLFQNKQIVEGELYQHSQIVNGDIWQCNQITDGNICETNQIAKVKYGNK